MKLAAALLLAGAACAQAQSLRPVDVVAREYVDIALSSNLALQGQKLEVERAEAALAAARARFKPEIALQARYTRTDGGREFDFPVGTLLNPAYQTLNELLVAQGQPPGFSTLEDITVPFQREREQDTRLTLRQPLYQPAIPAAVDAQRELLRGTNAAQAVLAAQLRRDVQLAYLTWLQALRAREVLIATREVLDENVRVNESLLRNGRITQDQLLRAQTEQLAITQQLRGAQSSIDQARRYVNFLLNRPLDTTLEDAQDTATSASLPAPATIANAGDRRAELQQIDAMATAAEAQQRATRASMKPSVSLGVDVGTQGQSWNLGPAHRFASASLVLSWKFFDGGANRAEADRAGLAARQARLQQENLTQQIALEAQQAHDQLAAASDQLQVAAARVETARAAFFIAQRKRDAGAISQVEFLDARSAQTAAELSLNLTRFELLQRQVQMQYALGDTGFGQP